MSVDISQSDARDLGQRFARHSIGAIVTEPYLGPPLTGREGPRRIRAISSELEDLYQAALGQFVKILKPSGRVVMVFPQWHLAGGPISWRLMQLVLSGATWAIDLSSAPVDCLAAN